MENDSTDIETGNILSLYQQRPKALEGLCLADFVSCINIRYGTSQKQQSACAPEEYLPEYLHDEDIKTGLMIK